MIGIPLRVNLGFTELGFPECESEGPSTVDKTFSTNVTQQKMGPYCTQIYQPFSFPQS